MVDIEVDKKTNRLLLVISIIILAPLIGLMYWKISHGLSGTEMILKEASDLSFNGKVDSTYRDEQNHNVKVVTLSNGYTYPLWADWESSIEVGDSLSKKASEFIVKVYKKDGKLIMLDYKKLVKSLK